MPTKYAHLRGQVPEEARELTERERAIATEMASYKDRSLLTLTAAYNVCRSAADELIDHLADVKVNLEAVERLIREQLDAEGADGVKMNGYSWSPTVEPYPQAEDPALIVQYFKDHGMEEQLVLKAGELATRLKSFIKEEAVNNDLIIVPRTFTNESGEEVTTNEVRSHIPGVRVFLKSSLSRVSSSR